MATPRDLVGDNDGLVLTYCPCCRTVYYGRVACQVLMVCNRQTTVVLPDSAKEPQGASSP